MKKRELFVFAGQSNMMGAAVYEPKYVPVLNDSFEYKHKPKRMGEESGEFTNKPFPTGEFSYIDLDLAYGKNKNKDLLSSLDNYTENTYFCPGMSNYDEKIKPNGTPFNAFSESNFRIGASMAPYFAENWEKLGHSCAYSHIAKGSTKIIHYFNLEMIYEYNKKIREYNQKNNKNYEEIIELSSMCQGASKYFDEKCTDFFNDSKTEFSDCDLGEKIFVWNQGESDASDSSFEYELKLDILWQHLKKLGFTKFAIVRVTYFGAESIINVMKAQENFCKNKKDVYMLTRIGSYFKYANRDESKWFIREIDDHKDTRDSSFGFNNQHINEKGFRLIAMKSSQNLHRILYENRDAELEDEIIKDLIKGT